MRFISLTLCLMAVTACGQVPPITDGEKYVLRVTKAVVDTSDSDSLYRRTAKFDTLYWAWGDPEVQVWVLTHPPILKNPTRWERIPGRWDTTTVEVCDTVWTTTEMAWWLESVVKVDGSDSSLWRMKRSGPGHGSRLIRTQVAEVRYRDSLVVTPKAIRWE